MPIKSLKTSCQRLLSTVRSQVATALDEHIGNSGLVHIGVVFGILAIVDLQPDSALNSHLSHIRPEYKSLISKDEALTMRTLGIEKEVSSPQPTIPRQNDATIDHLYTSSNDCSAENLSWPNKLS